MWPDWRHFCFITNRDEDITLILPEGRRAATLPQLDLLVVGTHGRGRLGRLLHGSVSGDVARSARCPVVAVPVLSGA
jgi:nucleotide-binding universal stress UspA family protein